LLIKFYIFLAFFFSTYFFYF